MRKPSKKSRTSANAKAGQALPQAAGPIAAAESVKQARRVRWNPLRNLTPDTLTRQLDAFEYGDLREFALLAEMIADRDDTIKSVKPKREKATAGRDWKVMKRDKSPEAEKHQEILQQFWQNVKAVNAYDRNERGGIGRLIKQMMTSVSYRYAAHHIVWDPKPGKLRATFEFVPLWFFENREGKLRFVKDGMGITGEDMDPREWMVTCGDGLMIACAIQYLGKRYCMQDWLAFSEKFSMPGILGATAAAKGSAEGNAMKSAVESFSQDWSAVMYGVADPSKPPIHLIQPDGNPTAMPMPAYIERADRKIATLYMGADLSTMSSKDGQGTGASLQSEELDNLITDDCMTISESLQEVEREVIRWHFGEDVEPLAYIEVQPPVQVDKKFILEAIKILTDMGVRLPVVEILESLGFTEADAADAALTDLVKAGKEDLNRKDAKEPAANASYYDPTQEAPDLMMQDFRRALAADMQPLGDAISSAYQAGDLVAMQAALRKISEGMPELAGDAANLSEVLAGQLADAWLGDDAPVETNGDYLGHPYRGNQWGGGDWMSHGLLPSAKIKADPSHEKTKAYLASARLMQGETVSDDAGNSVRFGEELLQHWEDKPIQEQRVRLSELDDAQDAVRNPHEVWQQTKQTIYLRKYTGNGPDRWMAVFVQTGTGRTYYSSERINKADESFRRGTLLRKR
jgi:phage gp29-like protein